MNASAEEAKLLITLFKTLMLPPAIQLLMIFFAWICWRRFRLMARLLLSFAVISLFFLIFAACQSIFVYMA